MSLGVDREIVPGIAALLKYNMSKTTHLTRFVNRNAAELGAPWSTGINGTNGITDLTAVESTAQSRYWGWTVGFNKRFENNFGFQAYYTYSKDKSDDDNERDPFTFRYAKIHEDPADPTAEFSREWGYSDRDQRHRLNAWLLWRAPGDVDLSLRYSYRSAQPLDVNAAGVAAVTPQDRINPDGTVTRRNQGRKDNQYSSLDFRISKQFQLAGVTIEPGIDVFNVFNSKNLRRPAVTNLVFNFDGTVQSGVGDPRQVQLGCGSSSRASRGSESAGMVGSGALSSVTSIEREIEEIVARETRAWDTNDVDLLLSVFHPDMVWPWPPDVAHDPGTWVFVMGRFDRERWREAWQQLFDTHALVHNRRRIVRIAVSARGRRRLRRGRRRHALAAAGRRRLPLEGAGPA